MSNSRDDGRDFFFVHSHELLRQPVNDLLRGRVRDLIRSDNHELLRDQARALYRDKWEDDLRDPWNKSYDAWGERVYEAPVEEHCASSYEGFQDDEPRVIIPVDEPSLIEIREATLQVVEAVDLALQEHVTSPEVVRNAPPAVAEFLMMVFASKKQTDAILGDMEERFSRDCKSLTLRRAQLRYWALTIRNLGPLTIRAFKRLGNVALMWKLFGG